MVASADHRATEAGVDVLTAGGSAVDAALATNAVLTVTAPHLCGLGGDLFALVHDGRAVTCLNASGRAGSGADPDRLRAEGHREMPMAGDIRATPVPGCVDGWLALHERHGRLPLVDLLAPAVALAEGGFEASPLLVPGAARAAARPGGGDFAGVRAPGDRLTRPGVGRTLRAIGAEGRAGFYLGEFGRGLLEIGDGEFVPADLERCQADWVEPLRGVAFGYDVWSAPPNSQGYLLLLGLAIAEGLDLPDDPADPAWAHLLVESARAAGHDRPALLHEHARAPLDAAEIAARRTLVDPARRSPLASAGRAGDTTYLCAVDRAGLGVSLIQSNAAGFGSLVFEPRTGINLQNRGLGFSLIPGHPAEYGPGRRPPHTLVPALVTRPDGSLRSLVGTMGGDAQPQILLQVLTRLLRYDEPPATAIGAPRWRLAAGGTGFDAWTDPDGTVVEVEEGPARSEGWSQGWSEGLTRLGHDVRSVQRGGAFGHAHLIDRLEGVAGGASEEADRWVGVADPRAVIGSAAALR